jgi:hypothetical protein
MEMGAIGSGTTVTTSTVAGIGPTSYVNVRAVFKGFQAVVTGSGAVSATVNVEGSFDGTNWALLTTLSPSGTNTGTAIGTSATPCPFVRANFTALTGTAGYLMVAF